MNRTIALISGLLPLTASIMAQAQQAPQVCPRGYSLIEQICISSTTGDIMLPTDKKDAVLPIDKK